MPGSSGCFCHDHNDSLKEVWNRYWQHVTIHGVNFMFTSKGVKRVIWTVFWFACLGLLTFNFTSLVLLYFKYPVTVSKEWIHASEIQFPAVTVCNTNPVRQSALSLSPAISAIVGEDSRRRKRSAQVDPPRNRRKRSALPDCTTALNPDTNSCYWIESESYEKSEAEAACESKGGFLAHVKTESTNTFLLGQGVGGEDMWISLEKQPFSSAYSWGDGEAMTWTNWETGQQDGGWEACVGISSSTTEWFDDYCQSSIFRPTVNTYSALCEKETAVQTTEALTTATTTAQTTLTPTTETMTTQSSTTETMTTQSPTTETMTTQSPTTETMTTQSPTTVATTQSPTTVMATTTLDATTRPTTVLETTPESETTILVETTESDTTSGAMTTEEVTTTIAPTSQYEDREPLREDFVQETALIEALANTPEELKVQMGYQQSEFLLDCKFAGEECRDSDIGTFFNSIHGNCYTFNAGFNENSTDLYFTSRAGSIHGLDMLININQAEYLASGSQGAGVVIVVHDKHRMPFPEDEGMLAKPGRLTSIEIRQTQVNRLGGNYGPCVDSQKSQADLNLFEELLPVKYSLMGCSKTCYQQHTIRECGCADPQFPMQGKALRGFSGSACDIQNYTQSECMYGVELRYIQDKLECDCNEICSETYFAQLLSVAQWPSQVAIPTVADYLETVHNINISDREAYLRKNIIKLQVYFSELNSEVTAEAAKYTVQDLVYGFAGSAGLFLGCSINGFLELIELLFDFLAFIILKLFSRKRKDRKRPDSIDDLANAKSVDSSGLNTMSPNTIAWG